MRAVRTHTILIGLVLFVATACSDDPATFDDIDAATEADAGADLAENNTPDLNSATVVFDYGDWQIPAGGEQYPCAQWTLNNDEPLYINAVVQSNDGGFHHSNWYAVKEDAYPGPDGFFDCEERNFVETSGAVLGEVVFAQSTQAYEERQGFPEGVAIKIPPRYKIIGGVHLLNISGSPLDTSVRMSLELIHPRDVEVVATPWRLDNANLFIPGNGAHTRWSTTCTLKTQYENRTGSEFAPLLYWILPHYHSLGDYFRVDVLRPQGDETIVELSGFNAEANGITFEEPIDMTGATGMRMVCGYTNPLDQIVYWGTQGFDEMCTLLAFTNAERRLNTMVWEEESMDMSDGGFETHHGLCAPLFLPKNEGTGLPSQAEIDAPLYIPESNSDGQNAVVAPQCEDTPADAEPAGAVTLSAIRDDVFGASCAYSACHDSDAPAGGLDFTADDLHAELMGHELTTPAAMALVAPGDPDNSWLYQVMSSCKPELPTGFSVPMPRNSPRLLPPGEVARVRAWIAAGARDD